MKITQRLLLVSLSGILVMVACRKVSNSRSSEPAPYYGGAGGGPTSYPSTGKSLNELFKDLRTASETQCVKAGAFQTIVFSKGTRLTFYPNSFKDAAGKLITSGTVCIELTEMYKPGEMMANRASTVTTTGEILTSGGQVYINATQNGAPVYANVYGIGFHQTVQSGNRMSLFYGNRKNKDSIVVWDAANTMSPGATVQGTYWGNDSTEYLFDSCRDFKFVNCDAIKDFTTPRTQVNISMPDGTYDNRNTMVFIFLPDFNTAIAANNYTISTRTFDAGSDEYFHKIPIGLKACFVAITRKGDDYYYFELKDQTIKENMLVNAKMTKRLLEDIAISLGKI